MKSCCCCCLVAKSCLKLCNPMDCSTPGSSVLHDSHSLLKFTFIESVMLPNHIILCRPLLLLPSVFPSIRAFSYESALCIRWPKYWSFSFNISLSSEYSGLISFKSRACLSNVVDACGCWATCGLSELRCHISVKYIPDFKYEKQTVREFLKSLDHMLK